MDRCKCGSYAINPRLHGRNPNTDLDLCDVCYFKKRLEEAEQRLAEAEELKADFKKAMKLFEDTGLDNLLWTLLDTITKGE